MPALSPTVAQLFDAFDEHEETILSAYFDFLRFPSISSEPAFTSDVTACREWLGTYLAGIGFRVEYWPSVRHPVIFAEWMNAGPDAPTVLIYHHYDVQPVEPLELWQSPPFAPEVRDGLVYARGAQDNKGQCWFTVAALEHLIVRGALPVNVKLCIEGEEEIASPGLAQAAREHREQLRADHLLVLDCCIPAPDRPAVTLGLRGISALAIEVETANFDLHSGAHGGLALNANHVLASLIASLHDAEGRIVVSGFYDRVRPLSPEERAVLSLEFDAKSYEREFGAKPVGVEAGYLPNESRWCRPALDVNGMSGGYTGDGMKTIIPAKARAILSARLVPDQDPLDIRRLIQSHLESRCPEGARLTFHDVIETGALAFRSSVNAPVVQAAARAYRETCGSCEFVLEGWSVPVIAELTKILDLAPNTALIGYGLSTDAIHAPNEHFSIERLRRGFVTMARLLCILGEHPFRN